MPLKSARALSLLVVIFGSLVWSLTMARSGLVYSFGMGFWGPNGHDGIWHVALIKHLAQGSLEMPVFAGESLKNYHWFYDGFLALIHRLTSIPPHTLYFQVFPPLTALIIGLLVYKFVLRWRKSELQALFALFFIYFGGSWGWLVSFLRGGELASGESMFWANQAISTLINPPYAASLILLMTGLILFLRYQQKPTIKLLALQALIFGLVIQVKAYAGVLALAGLGGVVFWQLLRQRRMNEKVKKYGKLFLGAAFVALLVFLPTNRNAGNLVVFSPLWFPESMAASVDRFYWPRLASAISTFKSGGNFFKLFLAQGLALAIFVFGNLGTRVLKDPLIFRWLKNWKKLGSLEVVILGIVGAGFLLPLLFIQKGNPWNTIQFLYYALFFSGILAGVYLGELLEKKRWGITLASLVVILTLPTTWGTLKHYLPETPPAAIPHSELRALKFLREQPEGVILTYPYYKSELKDIPTPIPLYRYESTAYVAAMTGKRVFLEDEVNLEITGYEWKPRRQLVERFFSTENPFEARGVLVQNKISYVYLLEGQMLPATEEELSAQPIYDEGGVRIYKVLF